MKRLKPILKICIVLSLLAMPAMAANNSSLLTPGMGMSWYNSQDQDFKNLMIWVFGGAIFIVAIFDYPPEKVKQDNIF